MEIDRKVVEHVADLARLELEPEKIEPMVLFLRDIIGHFRILEDCDTSHVDPLSDTGGAACPLRADEPSLWGNIQEALDSAPLREGSFFKVPAIEGEEGHDEV